MTIGINASLDHKIPKAKKGNNDIENLCWVDWKINLMKRDLDMNEFVVLCKKVISHRIALGGEMGLPISLKPEATRSLA